MTNSVTITPARQAMLELIKSNSDHTENKSSSTDSKSDDEPSKNKKNKNNIDRPNEHGFKRELDQMRRSAYMI